MTTSTLQLACPTCATCNHPENRHENNVTNTACEIATCDCMDFCEDYGARQAELATERAGERP